MLFFLFLTTFFFSLTKERICFVTQHYLSVLVSCPAQGQHLGQELVRDLVFVVSFHLSFSCVSLFSQKRAGYCGYVVVIS